MYATNVIEIRAIKTKKESKQKKTRQCIAEMPSNKRHTPRSSSTLVCIIYSDTCTPRGKKDKGKAELTKESRVDRNRATPQYTGESSEQSICRSGEKFLQGAVGIAQSGPKDRRWHRQVPITKGRLCSPMQGRSVSRTRAVPAIATSIIVVDTHPRFPATGIVRGSQLHWLTWRQHQSRSSLRRVAEFSLATHVHLENNDP